MSHKIPQAYARQYEGDDRSRKDRYTSFSPGLSSYYKERFGSRSPEEYQNLRFSHMSKSLPSDDIRDIILDEFRKYGPFEVKIVHNPEDNQRLAYVNFQERGMARKARRDCYDYLTDELGKHLKIDPAGVVRDQDGRNLDRQAGGPPRERGDYGGPPPPRYPPRDFQPSNRGGYPGRGRGGYSDRGHYDNHRGGFGGVRQPIMGGGPRRGPTREGENTLDDPMITRTLFCGNLAYEVRDKDIVRMFEKYGHMGSVEIKRPVDGSTPYAFVTFDKIEDALEAKIAEDDRPLAGGPRVRIGWGKSIPQQRLWVYGLGDWATEELIFREFDRYGVIDKVDFVREGDKAFITYDSIQSATDACKAMKNFPLGGKDRKIRVDFALAYECLDIKPPMATVNYDPHGLGSSKGRSPTKRRRSRSSSSASSRSRSPTPKREKIVVRRSSRSKDRSKSVEVRSDSDESRKERRSKKSRKSKKSKRSRKHRRSSSRSSSSSSRRSRDRSPDTPPPKALSRASERQRSISHDSHDNDAPRDISPSRSPTPELAANTITELEDIRKPAWTGVIVLKKSAYPIKLYAMQCDDLQTVLDDKLNDSNREAVRLHITQRLPWMANNLQDKFGESATGRAAYFLAVPNEDAPMNVTDLTIKPISGLVAYLNDKQAAGVVSLSGGCSMYTFPKSLLAEAALLRMAPKISVLDNAADKTLFLALSL